MSQMKELYDKVAKTPVLQEQFAAILKDAKADGKDITETKMIAFAKETGFEVSLEEINDFLAQEKKGELSDDDLDMVAGGKASITSIFSSVLSLGVACAIGSAVYTMDDQGCAGYFE